MAEQLGLRERKKLRPGEHIAETARRPVRRARVRASHGRRDRAQRRRRRADRLQLLPHQGRPRLLAPRVVRRGAARRDPRSPAGETLLAAFRRWLLAQRGLLAEEPLSDELKSITRMITESPALLAREQEIFARYTDTLARARRHRDSRSAGRHRTMGRGQRAARHPPRARPLRPHQDPRRRHPQPAPHARHPRPGRERTDATRGRPRLVRDQEGHRHIRAVTGDAARRCRTAPVWGVATRTAPIA